VPWAPTWAAWTPPWLRDPGEQSRLAAQTAHFTIEETDPAACFFDSKVVEILKTIGQISPKMQSYSFIDHSTLCKMQP
jgi:hypothetical protein